MKKQLIFDVATDTQIVIYAVDSKIITKEIRVGKKDHAAYMIPLIDKVLKENNLTIKQIDQIIVGSGPGSYTGIRVAVMTAKMLSYTNQIDLYEISSLNLLTSGYEGIKTPMIDARNNNYFSASYDDEKVILKEALYAIDDLSKYQNHIVINSDTIKVNLENAQKFYQKVLDVHAFTPKYLRVTEAERNHDTTTNNK
ncbi:Putative glycoprotease, peptidase M22 family [Alteracholeplasma palmae J233]|uniref:Putative glycoprotease, peptidase M22 family n=1 Tax=Alteracholeplasma palmae (strain ATCC 49389 / J233) TaxID=1318466 RepID=U4KQX9_ALTPJ|nr:tRNA (adenosine(37)-N6)-threonylcarbamoyltransferase complex dimerization subunit type 1 TsaB [Alteracholeplasma palmae]CCV63696.1 Putative glycoprotease, peptidase M22 family [Alteracholeplasma palmae J233]